MTEQKVCDVCGAVWSGFNDAPPYRFCPACAGWLGEPIPRSVIGGLPKGEEGSSLEQDYAVVRAKLECYVAGGPTKEERAALSRIRLRLERYAKALREIERAKVPQTDATSTRYTRRSVVTVMRLMERGELRAIAREALDEQEGLR